MKHGEIIPCHITLMMLW